MADTATTFLNIEGLTHFKQKMDAANEAKFVKNSSIDDIINNKLTTVYTYKGSLDDISELPMDGNKIGDVYDVAGGMNYAWDGTKWDALGDSKIAVDSALNEDSTNPVENKVIVAALNDKADNTTATDTKNGLMSAMMYSKLMNIGAISEANIDSMFE